MWEAWTVVIQQNGDILEIKGEKDDQSEIQEIREIRKKESNTVFWYMR